MSSGTSIPYPLRQNKAADRAVFFELLRKITRVKPVEGYSYLGFGGAYLEEFKTLHREFGMEDLISVERDEEVLVRQHFNKPFACIQLPANPNNLVDELDSLGDDMNVLVWLDYTSASDLYEQLCEIQEVATRAKEYDVLKITVNAHIANIPIQNPEESAAPQRINIIRERLGDYCPSAVKQRDATTGGYPKLLARALEIALERGLQHDLKPYPLTSFEYADGQTMLSITCVFLEQAQITGFLTNSGINEWEHYSQNWVPEQISLPDLSHKERLQLESLLPSNDIDGLIQNCEFISDKSSTGWAKKLNSYKKFYKHSPWYIKMAP